MQQTGLTGIFSKHRHPKSFRTVKNGYVGLFYQRVESFPIPSNRLNKFFSKKSEFAHKQRNPSAYILRNITLVEGKKVYLLSLL